MEAALHDQLSHQIPRICLGPLPDPGSGRLRLYVSPWSRGVDTEQFNPDLPRIYDELGGKDWPRPFFLNVGRVAVEKNIEAFLETDLPGTKIVVGDGPARADLATRYPEAKFLGARFGEELARCFRDADVFVFPSWTDTFGLVILEAMATGTPVAAFPAHGPIDIIPGSGAGAISDDLRTACLEALTCEPASAARSPPDPVDKKAPNG